MIDFLDLATGTLLSPVILSFALGLLAALARSDLSVPEAFAKAMSLYLLFAIGFKGGVSLSGHGFDTGLVLAIGVGLILSFGMPFVAFGLLSVLTRFGAVDRAAVAAHYGSISIVTFVTGASLLESRGIAAEGYMVAVAAAMEAPAILSALWLAARAGSAGDKQGGLWREILFNGSVVLLLGAFVIGALTGQKGMAEIDAFIVAPFKGILCLFLLDMGLVAGRGLRTSGRLLGLGAVVFGMTMPLMGALAALALGLVVGLSAGGLALLMVLGGSASYIAVPAAMRVALPDANPSIYLTLSLGVTFPFNLTLGLPIYIGVAQWAAGAS